MAVIVAALVIGSVAGSNYLDAQKTGAVGDGMCDVCGDSLMFYSVRLLADGEVINEFCQWHGLLDAFLHPGIAARSLFRTSSPATSFKVFAQSMVKKVTPLFALTFWWILACLVALAVLPKPLMLDR